ncbi:MAG: DUF1611 domain-containing protein [Candidatus Korarchaeum sp.]
MVDALILAEGKYDTSDAKTAHGLVRKSMRYRIVGVIDSKYAGMDAGEVLDGRRRGIKIYGSLEEALRENPGVSVLIVGVAVAGGMLPPEYRATIREAMERGLSVLSGLHEFLSDDPEFSRISKERGVEIIDVRKIYQNMKIFYSGRIREVNSYRIVVLGTDACIGKRTTAWMLADELNGRGIKAVFIGTGQTAWMQGAKYGIVLDAMINDFITGGLEHEVWRAYVEERPDVIIVPGQGAMLHPAFPGSFEIVNLLSPQAVILQHAPGRKHLEDFPEFPMPPLEKYIRLVELMTDRKPVAITVNTEGMSPEEVEMYIEEVERKYGIVACAPLMHGVGKIADLLAGEIKVGLEVLR